MKEHLNRLKEGAIILSIIAAIIATFFGVIAFGFMACHQGGLWHLGWLPILILACWILGAPYDGGW
jgi:hypothetical protein